jgi:Fe2+ transport system protein FeoA
MDLSQVKEGQSCTVERVGGDGGFRRRLLEMGILKDSALYVEKYAPLKDPLELIVKGYHVSLRVGEAARIKVKNVK